MTTAELYLPGAARVLDAGYAEHARPYVHAARQGLERYLFRLQTDGRARVLVDNRMMSVEAGDLLVFCPGQAYELRIETDRDNAVHSTDLYLFCDGRWVDEWWQKRPRKTHMRLALHENCVYLWRQLIEEHRRPGRADPELCEYLLRALCLTVDKLGYDPDATAAIPMTAERIRWYIERHAADEVTLRAVAAEAGLSVSRAVHVFKEAYGQTIVQYLLEVRLQMACDRMRFSTSSLEHIADLCGFRSYSYFYRAFRARFGVSPRAFRQRDASIPK